MKGLFVVFHGFSAHSGISKKIFAQRDGLRRNGAQVGLCYTEIASDGTQRRMVDDEVIGDYGRGIRAKIAKRASLKCITDYILREGIEFVYIRYDHNASPVLIHWLKGLKKHGIRIALEIPTYPYDREFSQSPWVRKLKLQIDRSFRRAAARHVDKIVTFSDDATIFGRPTIRISNGIDFDTIPLKQLRTGTSEVHLLGVANLHFWHGFDRVIEGLRRYYESPQERIVRFRIVGDGIASLIDGYRARIAEYKLGDYIEVAGPKSGTELDEQFAWCDLGVASLGRHRNGIDKIKTLKNREYAARGIPFVYSETDDDFDTMPYVMKAPADESPLDIAALLRFYDSVRATTPAQIRATITETLSWERQMHHVLEQLIP